MDVFSYVKTKVQLPSLMLSTGTILAGTACAGIRGNHEWLAASLCLLFAIFLQMGANLIYHYFRAQRYYDKVPHPRYERKEDAMNELHHRVLREGAFACFLLAAMIGLMIMAASTKPVLVFAAGVVIVGIVYIINASKRAFFGTFWALAITWMLFGPIGVMVSSFVEMQQISGDHIWVFFNHAPSMFVGPAMGFMACNVHLVYSYLLYRITPNATSGLTYRLTPTGVQVLIFVNGLLMLLLIFFGVFGFNYLKPLFASVPGFMGFALNTFLAWRIRRAPLGELRYLSFLCKLNYLVTGLALLIFWLEVGYPSASMLDIFG